MVKQILPALAFIIFLSSCSTFKPLNFTSNKQVAGVQNPTPNTKFIEEISVIPQAEMDNTNTRVHPEAKQVVKQSKQSTDTRSKSIDAVPAPKLDEVKLYEKIFASQPAEVESASAIQLKYAVLMDVEVESLPSKSLLEAVDEWYGVRYRTGGNTTNGVDCSGFTVGVYSALFGMAIPRVSREQYRVSTKLSTTDLQEGDLVFFNTNGRGVSHVGIYLGHNKFIHASVSKGVMVNDLFESYYLKRYIGGGKIEKAEDVAQGTH
jgi:lipoprotein Spr